MKWSVAGLLLLGIGAAISASILVASLKMVPPASANLSSAPSQIQILVATRDLPALSVVELQGVEIKSVPVDKTPKNHFSDTTEVVGKLLTVPVEEGQVLTSNCFAADKHGARLASSLKNGMRALSISLKPEKAGPLYPGCVVDVLVSLSRVSGEGSGIKEALSFTLLQGIEVLAIDDLSVMSHDESDDNSAEGSANSGRRERRDRLVTLRLQSNQAEALQLAIQHGTVSLALRNPLDAAPVEIDSTTLRDLADPYTRIVAAIKTTESAGAETGNPTGTQTETQSTTTRADQDPGMRRASNREPPPAPPEAPPQKPEDPRWDMIINRAGEIELVRFRQDQEVPQPGIQKQLDWIWDGRALPGVATGAGK